MRMPFEIQQSPTAVDVGQEWLYWDPKRQHWRRVELLEAAGDRPKRVRIQHLGADERGRAEWVPAGRLTVPSSLADEYLSSSEAVNRLASHAPDTLTTDLAEWVLSTYLPSRIADMADTSWMGSLKVIDLAALSDIAKINPELLTSATDTIQSETAWYLPWPSVERVLLSLMRRDPGPGMALLDGLVRQRQSFDRLVDEEGERWWMREDADESWARRIQRWHDDDSRRIQQLRLWLDQEQPSLAQSYLELRGLHAAMVEALLVAIPRVRLGRSQVAYRIADRLQRLVDTPTPLLDVRGLRASDDDATSR